MNTIFRLRAADRRAVVPDRRQPTTPRKRAPLTCVWHIDPTTGRPIARWFVGEIAPSDDRPWSGRGDAGRFFDLRRAA